MFSSDVRDIVNNELQVNNETPQRNLVMSLVEAEQTRRTEILTKTLELQETYSSRLKSIDKPDEVRKDRQGNITRSEYTDKRLGQIKKLEEKIDNLENKISDALTNADAKSWKALQIFVDNQSKENE